MGPEVRIKPTTPLSSEELKEDAENACVPTDEVTRFDTDAHFAASENERAEEPRKGSGEVERDITIMPPD